MMEPRRLAVFVASTFRDLDQERDLIHTEVIPRVNAESERHGWGIRLYGVDLRWGVETDPDWSDEDRQAEILRYCLDGIRQADLMICLMGDREGWAPPASVVAAATRYPKDAGLSVTDLEVLTFLDSVGPEYALGMRRTSGPQMFLDQLLMHRDVPVLSYTDAATGFVTTLTNRLLTMLNAQQSMLRTSLDIEVAEHQLFAAIEAQLAVTDAFPEGALHIGPQIDDIDWRYLRDTGTTAGEELFDLPDTMVLEGSPGNPATPYLAHLYTHPGSLWGELHQALLRDIQKPPRVAYVRVGHTASSRSVPGLLALLLTQVTGGSADWTDPVQGWQSWLSRPPGDNWVILIDGICSLAEVTAGDLDLGWLFPSSTLHWLRFGIGLEFPSLIRSQLRLQRRARVQTVPELTPAQAATLAVRMSASFGKQLPRSVAVELAIQSTSPAWLRSALLALMAGVVYQPTNSDDPERNLRETLIRQVQDLDDDATAALTEAMWTTVHRQTSPWPLRVVAVLGLAEGYLGVAEDSMLKALNEIEPIGYEDLVGALATLNPFMVRQASGQIRWRRFTDALAGGAVASRLMEELDDAQAFSLAACVLHGLGASGPHLALQHVAVLIVLALRKRHWQPLLVYVERLNDEGVQVATTYLLSLGALGFLDFALAELMEQRDKLMNEDLEVVAARLAAAVCSSGAVTDPELLESSMEWLVDTNQIDSKWAALLTAMTSVLEAEELGLDELGEDTDWVGILLNLPLTAEDPAEAEQLRSVSLARLRQTPAPEGDARARIAFEVATTLFTPEHQDVVHTDIAQTRSATDRAGVSTHWVLRAGALYQSLLRLADTEEQPSAALVSECSTVVLALHGLVEQGVREAWPALMACGATAVGMLAVRGVVGTAKQLALPLLQHPILAGDDFQIVLGLLLAECTNSDEDLAEQIAEYLLQHVEHWRKHELSGDMAEMLIEMLLNGVVASKPGLVRRSLPTVAGIFPKVVVPGVVDALGRAGNETWADVWEDLQELAQEIPQTSDFQISVEMLFSGFLPVVESWLFAFQQIPRARQVHGALYAAWSIVAAILDPVRSRGEMARESYRVANNSRLGRSQRTLLDQASQVARWAGVSLDEPEQAPRRWNATPLSHEDSSRSIIAASPAGRAHVIASASGREWQVRVDGESRDSSLILGEDSPIAVNDAATVVISGRRNEVSFHSPGTDAWRDASRHKADITAACVTSDGSWAATGDAAGTVFLWELGERPQVRLLCESLSPVVGCTTTPGGKLLTGHQPGDLRWWDPETGDLLHVVRQPDGLAALACSTGRFVATIDLKRHVRVFRSLGGERVGSTERRVDSRILTFAGGDSLVLGHSNYVVIMDVATDEITAALELSSKVKRIFPVGDGRVLAVGESGSWLIKPGD